MEERDPSPDPAPSGSDTPLGDAGDASWIDPPPLFEPGADDQPAPESGLGAIGQLVVGLLTVAGVLALVVATLVVLRWVFT